MRIHRSSCNFGYCTTAEKSVVSKIVDVFGKKQRKLYKVKWEGYPDSEEDTWESEKMLLEDGCREAIEDFWGNTNTPRTLDFYPDKDGHPRCWMCGWICKKNKAPRFLNAHVTRSKHSWSKKRAHLQARKDIEKVKLESRQDELEKVFWGKQMIKNCWIFEYLGSLFQADGDQTPDVKRRIAMAVSRASSGISGRQKNYH